MDHRVFRSILAVTTTLRQFCRETNRGTTATYRDMSCRQTRQILDHGKDRIAAFEYPLADRPLQRSRYGRCTQKAMRKESAAATHRHTLSLAPNSITLLRAQRLSHQGVASQHEKPNEGAGFFFLSLYFEGLFCTLSESLSGTSRPLMAFEETR